MYLKTQDIKKVLKSQDIKATKTRILVGLNKGMGNKVSRGTNQYLTTAYRSARGKAQGERGYKIVPRCKRYIM